MYKLKKNGLKWLKVLHLLCVCCWLGGAAALTFLNYFQAKSDSQAMLYGMNYAGHIVDVWVIIIPGAIGCLVTGLIYGLFTTWGFFKHRWLVVKWILTVAAILSGTFLLGEWEQAMLKMSGVKDVFSFENPDYLHVRTKHFVMSSVQIAMLLTMIWLSVFKPWKSGGSAKKPSGDV